ncbi:hypothetical protein JW898_01085 [Candidatus Woesearchaeota archaeon]|nr:hypothetical protein [Candidatus Woesearchaeota archaeon]
MKALIVSAQDWDKKGGGSVKTYQRMIEALRVGGIDAEYRFVTSTPALLGDLKEVSPDLVFSGAYYTFNDDGSVSGKVHEILAGEGVPFVGSDQQSLDLVLDKTALKDVWRSQGIPTPAYFRICSGSEIPEQGFPFIIKPSREGGSRGIDERSVVYTKEDLLRVSENLRANGFEELFAEQYLGRERKEFTVAVIGRGERKIVGPSEMIITKEGEKPLVITKKMKDCAPGTSIFEPEPVKPGGLQNILMELSGRMYDAAGMRDYARCDVIMGEDGMLYGIEINGQSVIENYFPTGMRCRDMDYAATINAIFLAAISRNIREGHALCIPEDMKKVMPSAVYDLLG